MQLGTVEKDAGVCPGCGPTTSRMGLVCVPDTEDYIWLCTSCRATRLSKERALTRYRVREAGIARVAEGQNLSLAEARGRTIADQLRICKARLASGKEHVKERGNVYFVTGALHRPHVKIGKTTQKPEVRIEKSFCPGAVVLATQPGYTRLERELHRRFAQLRINGNFESEWFVVDMEMFEYMWNLPSANRPALFDLLRYSVARRNAKEDPSTERTRERLWYDQQKWVKKHVLTKMAQQPSPDYGLVPGEEGQRIIDGLPTWGLHDSQNSRFPYIRSFRILMSDFIDKLDAPYTGTVYPRMPLPGGRGMISTVQILAKREKFLAVYWRYCHEAEVANERLGP